MSPKRTAILAALPFWSLLAPWLFLAAAATGGEPAGVEQDVKAEFIGRFADYVEWPASAFPADTSSFAVCTIGEGPLPARLERVMEGGRIKGRPARVRHLKKEGEAAEGCHILYIAPGARHRVDGLVRSIGRAPVLTIGDSPGLSDKGVLINLFLDGPHVRFAINADAAEERGLSVSSKLRVLAKKEGRR